MADFNWFLNRQGIQGRKGEKGDTGFSPTISVGTDTLDEYKLIIANESNSFETPNLRGNINIQDNGGTYLRYDAETKQISAQSMDAATADTLGGVRLSTEADIVEMGAESVVTPSDVADALPLYLEGEGAVTITQDELTSKTKIKVDVPSVNDLESRISTAEAEIADIQTDVTNLNNNKVAKTDLATTESAGIVKVDGTSITVAGDGTISASPSGTLPIASTTQLGGVKVDGTSIVADENGVISSVGGGGTGDVTAGGNNEFTGDNTFSKSIRVKNPTDPFQRTFVNYNGLGIGTSSEAEIKVQDNMALMPLKFIASKLTLSTAYDGSSESPIVTSDKLKAGENITLNKNAETGDITISSTGGGGGTGDVPIATTTTAGKVKPDGTTITVTKDGTISAVGGGGTLPDNIALLDKQQVFTETQSLRKGLIVNGSMFGDYAQIELRDNTDTSKYISISHQVFEDGSSRTGFVPYTSGKNIMTVGSIEMVSDSSQVDGNITTISTNKLKRDKFDGTEGYAILDTTSIKAGQNITIDKDEEAGTITINSSGGGGGTGDVPIATTQVAGKVKPDGTTITVTEDGTISANSSYTLPTASTTQLGGVKVDGTSVTINSDGVISATGGGSTPTNMVTTDTDQIITGAKTFTNSITFNNTLNMSTGNTDTLYIHSSGSYAQGYTTDIDFHKNLNIKGRLGGSVITLAPNGSGLNALKYKDSSNTSNPSYDILHTGNLVTGNNITISEPNSTGVRTISGPNNEYMASMAMPSSRYVDLELGASGASYIAPADGWFNFVSGATTAAGQFCRLLASTGNGLRQSNYSNASKQFIEVALPVHKGDEIAVFYSAPVASFRFYYATGSAPAV